jgi:lipoprotein signal peptidase
VNPKYSVALGVFAISVALDQLSKLLVRLHIGPRDRVEIIPNWLDFVLAENKGAAFSTMADSPYRFYVFGLFTLVAVGALLSMLRFLDARDRWGGAAVGLILSGAVGNAIDRVMKRSVTDFIRVYAGPDGPKQWCIEHFGTNVWPIFNIADSVIFIGVALFLLQYLFKRDEETAEAEEDSAGSDPLESINGDR